jgi:hypothetical protein
MIWGDIAKMLQKLPGASLSRNFLGPAQDQEKGERPGQLQLRPSSSPGIGERMRRRSLDGYGLL